MIRRFPRDCPGRIVCSDLVRLIKSVKPMDKPMTADKFMRWLRKIA